MNNFIHFFSRKHWFLHSQSKQPFVSSSNIGVLNRSPKGWYGSAIACEKLLNLQLRHMKLNPNILVTEGKENIWRSLEHQTGWRAPHNVTEENKGWFSILSDSPQSCEWCHKHPSLWLSPTGGQRGCLPLPMGRACPSILFPRLWSLLCAVPAMGVPGEHPQNSKYGIKNKSGL